MDDQRPSIASAVQSPEWMSSGEAADILGLRTRTLYRLIDEGQLPAYRFGRVIRLKRHEVDAFVESCRITPGSLEHLYPDATERQERFEPMTSSTPASGT
jgi:excisionase family DNA binding protein